MIKSFIGLILFFLSFSMEAQQQAVVVGEGFVRKSPLPTAPIVKILQQGDTIFILSKPAGLFYKIQSSNNQEGYLLESSTDWDLSKFKRKVSNEYPRNHSPSLPTLQDSIYAVIYFEAPAGIPIRKLPDVDAKEVSRCRTGDKVLLMGYFGGEYYRVKHGAVIGYLYLDFLVNNTFAVDSVNSYNEVRNKSKRLMYVDPKQPLSPSSSTTSPVKSTTERYTPSKTYHTGPRGGVYYINSKGKKTYKKKH